MIDKNELTQVVETALEGTGLFLVEVAVSADNVIDVTLDGERGVAVDDCVAVDRAVHAAFDRDADDYELTVGSAGLTSPLRVHRQWLKNVGRQLEVLTTDGRKLRGTLTEAGEQTFTLAVPTKVKPEGQKRPQVVDVPTVLAYDQARRACCVLTV